MESDGFVARLGELNAAGPDGFSRRTSTMPTRQITITDGAGQTVYSARTANTPEAADRRVKAGGFRRVSDWTDGICTVERVPIAEQRRKKIIIAASAIAAVVAAVAGCSALAFAGQTKTRPIPTATYVPPFTASGTLTIESLSNNRDLLLECCVPPGSCEVATIGRRDDKRDTRPQTRAAPRKRNQALGIRSTDSSRQRAMTEHRGLHRQVERAGA